MPKFLEVEITRTQSSVVYLEVPDAFDETKLFTSSGERLLSRAAVETVGDDEWDSFKWEETVECVGAKKVSGEEANQFKVHKSKAVI